MARITIEDCIEQVPNRFHLVQMAAIRAKQLKKGANPLVQSEDNKEVVMALREIAAGKITPDFRDPAVLEAERQALVQSLPDEAVVSAQPVAAQVVGAAFAGSDDDEEDDFDDEEESIDDDE